MDFHEATAKFYFFDVGVANILRRSGTVEEGSTEFGKALEHLIFLEIRSYLDYARIDLPLTYWRSRSQFEFDFVLGDHIAIEVKAKPRVTFRDYKSLLALDQELHLRRKIVVCREGRRRKTDEGVEMIPIQAFLKELWSGRNT